MCNFLSDYCSSCISNAYLSDISSTNRTCQCKYLFLDNYLLKLKMYIIVIINISSANLACNSNCTGCTSASICTGCSGSDSAEREPLLTCTCKSTAWNNGGTCTGIIPFYF